MRFSVKIFFLIYYIIGYPGILEKISVGRLYLLFLTSKNARFCKKKYEEEPREPMTGAAREGKS
jgi:hypothetical protein